jgi:lipopolysaccharide export system permease protein
MWRLSVPYLACGVLASLFLFLLNDVWMPHSTEAAERILNRYTDQQQSASDRKWVHNLNFRNDREGRVWNIGQYHLDSASMTNVQVEWALPGGVHRHIIAESGGYTNHIWFFDNVQLFTYRSLSDPTPMRETTNSVEITTFEETPEQIKSEVKINSLSNIKAAKKARLSIAEIVNYFRLHPYLTGEKKALLYTQLHARLAGPWTCLVVVLIAIPFGSATGRRNVYVGVASSIVLCFAFFIMSRFGLALGTSGAVPAWLAAWSPNLLFGGAGVFLTNRIR